MPTTVLAILLLLLGVALGTALGYAWAVARSASSRATGRDEASALRADAAQWRARAEELAERASLAEERAERDGSVLRALAPVRAQLEQVGARVEAMEVQRASEHAALAEQLRAGARTDDELRRATASLEGALRSRSTRGMWGEVELSRVLEASGMMRHVDFDEQRTTASITGQRQTPSSPPARSAPSPQPSSSSQRPDVVVHLPGDGHLAIDAKAPMDAYLRACAVEDQAAMGVPASAAPGDDDGGTAAAPSPRRPAAPDAAGAAAQRAALMKEHAKAVRHHVDALADRHYDRALGNSPELVVLFIPAEPVLAAALDADPALLEHALNRGVALATPSSLLAVLRTCAAAWSRAAVSEDARALLELGRTLYERLGTVAQHLDSLGSSLSRSVTAYNRAVGSVESRLLVTARSLESLGQDLPAPRRIDPDAGQVRQLTQPELVADKDDAAAREVDRSA